MTNGKILGYAQTCLIKTIWYS